MLTSKTLVKIFSFAQTCSFKKIRKKATIFNFPYLFALLIVAVKRLQTQIFKSMEIFWERQFFRAAVPDLRKKSLITSTAKEGEERFCIICSVEYEIYWRLSRSNQRNFSTIDTIFKFKYPDNRIILPRVWSHMVKSRTCVVVAELLISLLSIPSSTSAGREN